MNDAKEHRKKMYVDRMLQGRLALRVSIYWLLYHVVLWHAMFFLNLLEYREAVLANGQKTIPFTQLYGAFAWQHRSLAVCALAVSPIILWDIIRLSHRIAGPLVRLESTLMRMAGGETIRELKFRKGDWVVGLERAFNLYLASLLSATASPGASETRHASEASPKTPSAGTPADVENREEFHQLLRDLEEVTHTVASIHSGSSQAAEPEENSSEPPFRRRPNNH